MLNETLQADLWLRHVPWPSNQLHEAETREVI